MFDEPADELPFKTKTHGLEATRAERRRKGEVKSRTRRRSGSPLNCSGSLKQARGKESPHAEGEDDTQVLPAKLSRFK